MRERIPAETVPARFSVSGQRREKRGELNFSIKRRESKEETAVQAQIIAVMIFLVMFVLIISDKIERHVVALGCGLLTLVLVLGICMGSAEAVAETLNLRSMLRPEFWYQHGGGVESAVGVNWSTILFIAGMMIMVEGMSEAGFFRWLCLMLAALVRYRTVPLFFVFMIVSAGLAMFIDSITVIMFLAAVTVELSRVLRFDPVPMILSEIFCANLGGAATMCGDPPNIIIGTSLGYSFFDFLENTGLMAGVSLIAVLLYFYAVFRKRLSAAEHGPKPGRTAPAPKSAIRDKGSFLTSCVIFCAAVALLMTHAQTGLTVALIGAVIAAVTLIAAGGKNAKKILRRVDYKTLLFFIGLFLVVGGLEQTGVLEALAVLISRVSGGNGMLMVGIILWVSAIASAFVDNIPFAATMIPVIKSLSASQGIELPVLAWALTMGADIGGSATPIGASANVVGTAIAAKSGHPISWKKYCGPMVPAAILVVMISMVIIFIRYF